MYIFQTFKLIRTHADQFQNVNKPQNILSGAPPRGVADLLHSAPGEMLPAGQAGDSDHDQDSWVYMTMMMMSKLFWDNATSGSWYWISIPNTTEVRTLHHPMRTPLYTDGNVTNCVQKKVKDFDSPPFLKAYGHWPDSKSILIDWVFWFYRFDNCVVGPRVKVRFIRSLLDPIFNPIKIHNGVIIMTIHGNVYTQIS